MKTKIFLILTTPVLLLLLTAIDPTLAQYRAERLPFGIERLERRAAPSIVTAIKAETTIEDLSPAAVGDLDPTFGNGGKVITVLPDQNSARNMAIQPDGKIVVQGGIELEFQETGYYVDRFYKASFGRQPNYAEFTSDRSHVIGGSNLEASKQAFADEWVQRPAFVAAYPITMSNTEVVNKLFDSAGLTSSIYDALRQQEILAMNAGRSRALVLRDVIEIPDFKNIPDPNNADCSR